MDIHKVYSFDYCWDMAAMMNHFFDYQKEFFTRTPVKNLTATMAIMEKEPHPAEIDRAWHRDPLRKHLLSLMIRYECLTTPETTIIMSKEEFNNSTFAKDFDNV